MPLVRIDVQQGRSPEALTLIADTVYDAMRSVFDVVPRDRYQIITEHPVGHIIAEDAGLGFERTDEVVVIQVFEQGRSAELKQALYRELATRLEERCGVKPTDLIVSVVPNSREDWSLGLGRAQFLEGDL